MLYNKPLLAVQYTIDQKGEADMLDTCVLPVMAG